VGALVRSCFGGIDSGGTDFLDLCALHMCSQLIQPEMGNFSPGIKRVLEEDFCPDLEDGETLFAGIT